MGGRFSWRNLSPRIGCGPHADDEVLGAGGLIARTLAQSWEFHVFYVTVSGYSPLVRGDASQTDARSAEVEAALKLLGGEFSALFVEEIHHRHLDQVSQPRGGRMLYWPRNSDPR